jgi:hypothetical protein
MEYDRFEKHHILYLIGLISLILACISIGLGLYCLPYVLFNFIYSMPWTFFSVSEYIQKFYGIHAEKSGLMIIGILIFIGMVFILVAELISNYIERKDLGFKQENFQEELPQWVEPQNGMRNTVLVILILMLAVGAVNLLEWSVSSNT